jgi:hypothetical protein
VAAGDVPVTGAAIAGGLLKLRPPGASVDVGPGGIFDAFNRLQRGEQIDLRGTGNALDWDAQTGTPTASYKLRCIDPTGNGFVDSGAVYVPGKAGFDGPFGCQL